MEFFDVAKSLRKRTFFSNENILFTINQKKSENFWEKNYNLKTNIFNEA